MKKIFSLVFSLAAFTSFSQTCDNFYYFQQDKIVEMSFTNRKGKVTGKNVYTISDLKKTGGTTSATVNSELFDNEGKTISKATNNMKCISGVMMMDMKLFIPSGQQAQMGTADVAGEVYLAYPANLKEGDMLDNAEFNADFKMQSGIGAHLEMKITNRKVVGKESVTTPAGTWDCFKISYHSKTTVKIGIGIPINANAIEWYAPGFGVVKTESGGAKSELTSIK